MLRIFSYFAFCLPAATHLYTFSSAHPRVACTNAGFTERFAFAHRTGNCAANGYCHTTALFHACAADRYADRAMFFLPALYQ